ncbi:EamA family transporter [Flavobacterium sp. Sd200]|uniref:EamA family transporter n=1 Tax=Flavobacterium sp. Sd200 TaxID=2692211 RepID=UPI00136A3648|nr:DMT family transporter [Flavobacterium sp. Sd200]MXN92031.1 EamA family transporter [Flavobacterium sp. Sd200]
MAKNNVFQGVVYVGLGAASYGMLATFVKLAYTEGYSTAEVTASQILLGLLGMFIIFSFQKNKKGAQMAKASVSNRLSLVVAGTSMGFTSVFYYMAVKYIPVSIAIVLLMQTVWMGVLLEWMLNKKAPSGKKIIAVLIVLAGTVLATNLINSAEAPSFVGIAWGLAAAASFTATMFAGNSVATHLTAPNRSLYMLMGSAVIVLAFTIITWKGSFDASIFLRWGIPLALFGTVLPPLLLNAGFPKTGIGLGSIVSSIELPVSVSMAYVILSEPVNIIQWMGIGLILGAVVLLNTGKQC